MGVFHPVRFGTALALAIVGYRLANGERQPGKCLRSRSEALLKEFNRGTVGSLERENEVFPRYFLRKKGLTLAYTSLC